MQLFRFWAFIFAALACMAVGVELERFLTGPAEPGRGLPSVAGGERPAAPAARIGTPVAGLPESVMDWEPLSTRALWQQVAPVSLEWAESIGREQVHEGVWESGVLRVLGWPPALWLAALSALSFLLARLQMGQSFPVPGASRRVVRALGLGLAAAGFAVVGADLFRAAGAWEPRSIAQIWTTVHAASLDAWGRESAAAATLGWPAWGVLLGVGILLAFLARPRNDLSAYAYAGADVVPVRMLDLSRTLAYLDSMRSWPPRSRRVAARAEPVDPRPYD